MAPLFSTTLFLSAWLLFLVQPMIARMVLPLLGGVPAVWNTCMVFFQALLLVGYAYAHWVSTRLSMPRQLATHCGLLTVSALTLPFGVSEQLIRSLSPEAPPWLWLLSVLCVVVGLPFFAVASTGPLLQKWYSQTGQAGGDPYFLYSASNLGSLLALLAYPILLEPHLRLPEQSGFWAIGYVAMALCILCCGLKAWRACRSPRANENDREPVRQGAQPTPSGEIMSRRQRVRWLAAAFVPSSLMLGVTSYIGTDIASIPLLWIVPLSIYLLSFVLVFSRRKLFPMSWLQWLLPTVALGVVFQILGRGTDPVWLVILIHLLLLFLAAMVCHGRLAAERPAARHLTEFYLWVSLGGVLGGVFNALLAPNLFRTVVEYPLAIVFACLLRPPPAASGIKSTSRALDIGLPILLGVFTAGLAMLAPFAGLKSVILRNAVIVGLPAIVCFTFVDRPMRFGLGLAGILVGGWFYLGPHGKTLHVERNFFGIARVTLGEGARLRYLVHGNTLHGAQFVDPGRQCEPLAYYHRSGPLGDIFDCFQNHPASPEVAVVGLGAGATACYAKPTQHWTFYEIDPAVIRIARNTNYFSYLPRCAQTEVRVIVGDARLRLKEAAPRSYGLIVLDAFSSDAIPVHLLTREALALYVSKLTDGGLLVFHISNRYLDLEPVLADLAGQAKLISRHWEDWNVSPEESANGKEESHWVVVARRESDLGQLSRKARWLPLEGRSPPQVWTDDFSNLLGVFKWR
jgi:SAM-dependent methyltransferase